MENNIKIEHFCATGNYDTVERQHMSGERRDERWRDGKTHPAYLSYSIKELQRQLLIEYTCAMLYCTVRCGVLCMCTHKKWGIHNLILL